MLLSYESHIFIKDSAKYYSNKTGMTPQTIMSTVRSKLELRDRRTEYESRELFLFGYREHLDEELLKFIYRIGIEDYKTRLTYGEFLECLIFEEYRAERNPRQKVYFFHYRANVTGNFRERQKFVKKKKISKKEQTEKDIIKNDWRQRKCFNLYSNKNFGRKTYAKKYSNKRIRLTERRKAVVDPESCNDFDHKVYRSNHWMWD